MNQAMKDLYIFLINKDRPFNPPCFTMSFINRYVKEKTSLHRFCIDHYRADLIKYGPR